MSDDYRFQGLDPITLTGEERSLAEWAIRNVVRETLAKAPDTPKELIEVYAEVAPFLRLGAKLAGQEVEDIMLGADVYASVLETLLAQDARREKT